AQEISIPAISGIRFSSPSIGRKKTDPKVGFFVSRTWELLGRGDRAVFDQQRVVVTGPEIAVEDHLAGHLDGVADSGGLLAGDDQVVAVLVARTVLHVHEVAAHDAVIDLDDLALDRDFLAGQRRLVLVHCGDRAGFGGTSQRGSQRNGTGENYSNKFFHESQLHRWKEDASNEANDVPTQYRRLSPPASITDFTQAVSRPRIRHTATLTPFAAPACLLKSASRPSANAATTPGTTTSKPAMAAGCRRFRCSPASPARTATACSAPAAAPSATTPASRPATSIAGNRSTTRSKPASTSCAGAIRAPGTTSPISRATATPTANSSVCAPAMRKHWPTPRSAAWPSAPAPTACPT